VRVLKFSTRFRATSAPESGGAERGAGVSRREGRDTDPSVMAAMEADDGSGVRQPLHCRMADDAIEAGISVRRENRRSRLQSDVPRRADTNGDRPTSKKLEVLHRLAACQRSCVRT